MSLGERPEVSVLRALFRGLYAFRSTYESDGVEDVVAPDGSEWNLFDLEYLYREGLPMLKPRQWQAIELCLVRNILEPEAARMMGIKETNPVSMYATDGLVKLIGFIEEGLLPRFQLRPARAYLERIS